MKPRRKRWQKHLDERTRQRLDEGHRIWRKALNEHSIMHALAAGKHKQPWVAYEDEAVMRLDVPIATIARTINRSRRACEMRRYKLRKQQ